jgi:hypothetical protein
VLGVQPAMVGAAEGGEGAKLDHRLSPWRQPGGRRC